VIGFITGRVVSAFFPQLTKENGRRRRMKIAGFIEAKVIKKQPIERHPAVKTDRSHSPPLNPDRDQSRAGTGNNSVESTAYKKAGFLNSGPHGF
jgi:hypothetical protein